VRRASTDRTFDSQQVSCPVLSVPSGRSRDGAPTGLSIVAKTYDHVTAFRVAAHEDGFPWFDEASRRPAL
jgi:Asp-tRNA(Asn)/Glu-tRNA(Gln) amidotransferase A subunit family amidase